MRRVAVALGTHGVMGDEENRYRYLVEEREDLLGTLDGPSEHDVRRPLMPAGEPPAVSGS